MRLLKSLYNGYNSLRKSRVVLKRDTDDEALKYFQKLLNNAQPTGGDDLVVQRFVKSQYNDNKHRYLSFIRNTASECLVLWTESRSIVNFLGLRGLIYIKWDGSTRTYQVTKFKSREAALPALEHPAVAAMVEESVEHADDEGYQNVPRRRRNSAQKTEPSPPSLQGKAWADLTTDEEKESMAEVVKRTEELAVVENDVVEKEATDDFASN